jgi:hypothetical protein
MSPSDYMKITKNEVLLRSYGSLLWFPVFLHDNQDSYNIDFKKVSLHTPKHLKPVFVGNKLNEYVEGDWAKRVLAHELVHPLKNWLT